MNVNALIQVKSREGNEETFWFPFTHNPGKEPEHTPIQQRSLNKPRELGELERLDCKKSEASRNIFMQSSNGTTT